MSAGVKASALYKDSDPGGEGLPLGYSNLKLR